MYQHHIDSLERMQAYFAEKAFVIALIFGGSVAKGCERPDSDLDAMVIVTDAMYAQLVRERRTTECITGYCTYPEGYFDVKYYDKAFLRDVAEKGSEPARNAFLGARCLFSHDPEIPGLVEKIPVFQRQEKDDKLLSFYAAFTLNTSYFWEVAGEDFFLKSKAANEMVLFGLRMILEENEVLFPCPKGLFAAIRRTPDAPEGILEKAEDLLRTLSEEAKERFVSAILAALRYQPPEDYALVGSRYVEDNELWWRNPRLLVAEW